MIDLEDLRRRLKEISIRRGIGDRLPGGPPPQQPWLRHEDPPWVRHPDVLMPPSAPPPSADPAVTTLRSVVPATVGGTIAAKAASVPVAGPALKALANVPGFSWARSPRYRVIPKIHPQAQVGVEFVEPEARQPRGPAPSVPTAADLKALADTRELLDSVRFPDFPDHRNWVDYVPGPDWPGPALTPEERKAGLKKLLEAEKSLAKRRDQALGGCKAFNAPGGAGADPHAPKPVSAGDPGTWFPPKWLGWNPDTWVFDASAPAGLDAPAAPAPKHAPDPGALGEDPAPAPHTVERGHEQDAPHVDTPTDAEKAAWEKAKKDDEEAKKRADEVTYTPIADPAPAAPQGDSSTLQSVERGHEQDARRVDTATAAEAAGWEQAAKKGKVRMGQTELDTLQMRREVAAAGPTGQVDAPVSLDTSGRDVDVTTPITSDAPPPPKLTAPTESRDLTELKQEYAETAKRLQDLLAQDNRSWFNPVNLVGDTLSNTVGKPVVAVLSRIGNLWNTADAYIRGATVESDSATPGDAGGAMGDMAGQQFQGKGGPPAPGGGAQPVNPHGVLKNVASAGVAVGSDEAAGTVGAPNLTSVDEKTILTQRLESLRTKIHLYETQGAHAVNEYAQSEDLAAQVGILRVTTEHGLNTAGMQATHDFEHTQGEQQAAHDAAAEAQKAEYAREGAAARSAATAPEAPAGGRAPESAPEAPRAPEQTPASEAETRRQTPEPEQPQAAPEQQPTPERQARAEAETQKLAPQPEEPQPASEQPPPEQPETRTRLGQGGPEPTPEQPAPERQAAEPGQPAPNASNEAPEIPQAERDAHAAEVDRDVNAALEADRERAARGEPPAFPQKARLLPPEEQVPAGRESPGAPPDPEAPVSPPRTPEQVEAQQQANDAANRAARSEARTQGYEKGGVEKAIAETTPPEQPETAAYPPGGEAQAKAETAPPHGEDPTRSYAPGGEEHAKADTSPRSEAETQSYGPGVEERAGAKTEHGAVDPKAETRDVPVGKHVDPKASTGDVPLDEHEKTNAGRPSLDDQYEAAQRHDDRNARVEYHDTQITDAQREKWSSLDDTPYDPRRAEINMKGALNQLDRLAAGELPVGVSREQAVDALYRQYQAEVTRVELGAGKHADYWERMPPEARDFLQQHADNPLPQEHWLEPPQAAGVRPSEALEGSQAQEMARAASETQARADVAKADQAIREGKAEQANRRLGESASADRARKDVAAADQALAQGAAEKKALELVDHVNRGEPGEQWAGIPTPSRDRNCVRCAVAAAHTLESGKRVEALPVAHATLDQLEGFLGRPFERVAAPADIAARLPNPGDHGVVVVMGPRAGHAFNAVNIDGHVVFVDSQNRTVFGKWQYAREIHFMKIR